MTSAPRLFPDQLLSEKPRVLLVDDDEVNLLLTSIALRERGFSVTEASRGTQALQILTQWLPDVVVLDAIMPEMDGFATCREIRQLPGYESLPILMLTGLDDDASIARAYEAGATDFFVKCTQWSLLVGRLHYLLRSSRTRAELERSKSKLAKAQELARMGSFDWRWGQRKVSVSLEGQRVLGLTTSDELTLREFLRMLPSEERRGMHKVLYQVVEHNTIFCTDVPVVLKDGRELVLHFEAEPEFNEQGLVYGYTGIVQDVTDRHLAENKINQLSNFDALTGLPNRRQLIWRAERAIEHAKRHNHTVALLLIDLDRFKVINDTLGHAAGDELLLEVSRRLRQCVRHSDQVVDGPNQGPGNRGFRTLEAVARLGGDEFIALLPEVTSEQAARDVANKMLEALREPVAVGGQDCFVTASVGIATFPADGLTVADLMRNADVAMYTAKSQGRNAALAYAPHLGGKGRELLELESALHKALERQELVLHYQPKIDIRAGRMIGVEALMRWQRNGTLIPPNEFIPLAEETGLIMPMSEWAIEEAARQVRRWQQGFGFKGSVAINLPTRFFERGDLIQLLTKTTCAQGIAHNTLQLEITETGLMKDLQGVTPAMHQIKEFGAPISIDDFGTGYSSLAYLTSLPISELKIDRSFVRHLGLTPQSSAIATAIMALSNSLGLQVVAEGVETHQQMEVLYGLGCHLMQGFLFSKAISAADLEAWVKQAQLPRLGQAQDDEEAAVLVGQKVAGVSRAPAFRSTR